MNKIKISNLIGLVLFCLLNFNFLSAQEMALAEKKAIIKFETETIDYGNILQNSDGTKELFFTNEGMAPLTITNVKASCGCTVASFSKTPIMPGQRGSITVKYNTKKLGAFTKTITVYSNASESKKIIKVKGDVKKDNC